MIVVTTVKNATKDIKKIAQKFSLFIRGKYLGRGNRTINSFMRFSHLIIVIGRPSRFYTDDQLFTFVLKEVHIKDREKNHYLVFKPICRPTVGEVKGELSPVEKEFIINLFSVLKNEEMVISINKENGDLKISSKTGSSIITNIKNLKYPTNISKSINKRSLNFKK